MIVLNMLMIISFFIFSTNVFSTEKNNFFDNDEGVVKSHFKEGETATGIIYDEKWDYVLINGKVSIVERKVSKRDGAPGKYLITIIKDKKIYKPIYVFKSSLPIKKNRKLNRLKGVFTGKNVPVFEKKECEIIELPGLYEYYASKHDGYCQFFLGENEYVIKSLKASKDSKVIYVMELLEKKSKNKQKVEVATIDFLGDLDGDGKLDIITNTYVESSWTTITLFLSSIAKKGKLFGVAGKHKKGQ